MLGRLFWGVVFTSVLTVFASPSGKAGNGPPDDRQTPENWPCEQRYDPGIGLTTVWNGPPIDDWIDVWWEDADVFEIVETLKDPLLSEEEMQEIIDSFVKTVNDKDTALRAAFAGLYQRANERRRLQQRGIVRFAERQDQVTRNISETSKKLRKLRKEGVDKEDPEFATLVQKMEWNTRVYDERTRLTEYICEEPVFTVQNLGILARLIEAHLQK